MVKLALAANDARLRIALKRKFLYIQFVNKTLEHIYLQNNIIEQL